MPRNPRTPSGFTLIELLIVLFILGLIAALLLPAIQYARESARRIHCQSNLREWGVAILGYESIHAKFPPGYRLDSPSSSIVPFLFDHIEQRNVPYNRELSFGDLRNRAGESAKIGVLLCPSTPNADRYDASRFFPAAVGDYAPIHGVNSLYCELAGWPPFHPPIQNGILTRKPCKSADVKDGLSQTVLFVEDAGRPLLWRMRRPAEGIARAAAWANPEYGIVFCGSDRQTHGSGKGFGICVMNCTNDNEPYSFHPSGSNLLFADGGVRFVSEETAPRAFAAMITRSSGDSF